MYRLCIAFIFMSMVFTGCAFINPSPADTDISQANCAACHGEVVSRFEESVHGKVGVTCGDCHENLEAHAESPRSLPTVDVRGDSCASCHTKEHTQWLASPHAKIPTELFPDDMRVMQCMKCHQGSGFAEVIESGADFKTAWGPPPDGEPEPVTCIACHSPHNPRDEQMLRLSKGELCSTCHGGKWQNQIVTGYPADPYAPPGSHSFGEAPAVAPAHPFGDKDYSAFANHPHNSGDRCVACHMAKTPGMDSLGGHTFSMRTTADGRQNTVACASCHENADSYDINGKQSEVKAELLRLEKALKDRNNGVLPGNQPGTCNQCHKGGSLPFDNDPDFILSNAYETYKQVDRDKSFGVHNTPFVLQILRDAIEAVENLYKP